VEILKLCTVHHSLRQTYRRVAELRHWRIVVVAFC
jgi:hypothetical protein